MMPGTRVATTGRHPPCTTAEPEEGVLDRDDPAAQARATLRAYQDPARYLVPLGGTADATHPLRASPAVATSWSGAAEPDPDVLRTYVQHSCDLTLRGGAAAAVTYPLLACALAEHHLVRRVAGSGAAAVAAAAVAAAELGRTARPDDAQAAGTSGGADEARQGLPGYAGLARATAWLAGVGSAEGLEGPHETVPPRLAGLLAPSARMRGPYLLLCALLGPVAGRGGARRALAVLAALTAGTSRGGRVAVALVWAGVVAGWAGLTVALLRSPTVQPWVVLVASPPLLVTVALAGLAATVFAGVRGLGGTLDHSASEQYGLVPGVPVPGDRRRLLDRLAGRPDPDGAPSLVPWLADLLDELAGVRAAGTGRALTFGDLWLGRTDRSEGDDQRLRRADADPEQRVIDLRLVATDVTSGRPVQLPPAPGWLFCEACLRGGLPERLVTQLVAAAPPGDANSRCPGHDAPLRPVPTAADLPVAVAVRMAAGPAGLLRSVPLFRAHPPVAPEVRDRFGGWAAREDADPVGAGVTTHWFCDAGADADIDMFDSALPRWPTLGLAVRGGADADDDGDGPWVDVAVAGARARTAPVLAVDGARDMLTAVLSARSGSRDRAAAGRQGEQGRIGVVRRGRGAGTGPFLTGDEVLRLALRGHHAGRELRAVLTGRDGDVGTQTGTDRYRWLRLRTALRAQRELSLVVAARLPIYADVAAAYRVPAGVAGWFTPPVPSGRVDPAWADATAALTHLRSLATGGVLDWDTDYGAPPRDEEP